MSLLTYLASDYPWKERPNPHDRVVSVNDAHFVIFQITVL